MMNNDKCVSISFNNLVDAIFYKMDYRLKLVWLSFLASVICMFIYIIFKPSTFYFTFIVYGFVISIINIMDNLTPGQKKLVNYLNIITILIFVLFNIYILFKPMVNVIFNNAPKIYTNSIYTKYIWWITALYLLGCIGLFMKCQSSNWRIFCKDYGILIFTVITTLYLFIYMMFNLLSTTKEGLDGSTGAKVGTILPIPTTPREYNYSLASYYIMTASDCCLDPSNTSVSIDALKNVITKGARCLDFQIFSVNNTPVVSYSSSKDNFYYVNITNTIPFSDVMKTIATYAFQEATCSNFSDPLFIHLRIKSNNDAMFPNLTNILSSYINYMLNSQYNYNSLDPINIPGMSLPSLRNKIVIIIDNKYPSILKYKPIIEYVNIISNNSFCQTMTYNDYKNAPNITQLIDFNRTALTIVLPDNTGTINPYPTNTPISKTNSGGVQMTGISFQYNNAKDISFFTDAKYAFILKPEGLRSTPPPIYKRIDQPIDPIPKTTSVQGGLKITL